MKPANDISFFLHVFFVIFFFILQTKTCPPDSRARLKHRAPIRVALRLFSGFFVTWMCVHIETKSSFSKNKNPQQNRLKTSPNIIKNDCGKVKRKSGHAIEGVGGSYLGRVTILWIPCRKGNCNGSTSKITLQSHPERKCSSSVTLCRPFLNSSARIVFNNSFHSIAFVCAIATQIVKV